jgi:hypothetical protein
VILQSKLTWERSEQIDLGVDLTAFNGKLNFTADYYKKNNKRFNYS